jgi:hypothetical protein
VSRVISIWAALLAAIVVSTSIYGGFHFYSPVPFWDQWDGHIGFYQRFADNPLNALWSQHMEHRIVLSRVLFLIDLMIFRGGNAFLLVCNYLLAAGTAAVLIREYLRGHQTRASIWVIAGIALVISFAWIQGENLKWGFQSGSLGVNFFAIWAFAQFSRPDSRAVNISAAMVLCVVATLTMGNGIAGFGVMLIQAFLQRRPVREYVVVAICGALTALAYYHNYHKPELPMDPAVAHVSLARLKFYVIFMGNPIFLVNQNLMTAALTGIVSVTVFTATVLYLFVKRTITPYRAFLIASYGFIAASAMGATSSRWMLGLVNAAAGRYTSPVLVSFAALALLLIDVVSNDKRRVAVAAAILCVMSYIGLGQRDLRNDTSGLFYRKMAVLGQKIGQDRPDYDALIYPANMHEIYMKDAEYGARHRIGVYAEDWLRDAGVVKFDPKLVDRDVCQGHVDATSGDKGKIVVGGWASAGHREDLLILITDDQNQTIGYGVTGQARPDVAKLIHGAPADSGWTAIATVDHGPLSAYAYVLGRFCPLQ